VTRIEGEMMVEDLNISQYNPIQVKKREVGKVKEFYEMFPIKNKWHNYPYKLW
jgi:hypothetical protein